MYVDRQLKKNILEMFKKFPVISITGPRQSGKTTFIRNTFPDFEYINLERLDILSLIKEDPIGFLSSRPNPVIFDEAQKYPELFSFIQVISDQRRTAGQYILLGSQSFLLNEYINQTLAGRISINKLLPFDVTEISNFSEINVNELIWKGGYPRIYDFEIPPEDFYPSYIQTYIERDIRTLKNIGDLHTFATFTGLCAGRIGQLLNLSSIANDAGVSVNTAKSWISILEASYIITLLRPYYKNVNKRLIKSPKLYFVDTGLACSLLRINTPEMINTHYLKGSLFENLIISDLIKQIEHRGRNVKLYFWKESNGVEIDCIIEKDADSLMSLEIKAGQSYNKDYVQNLKAFRKLGLNEQSFLIYQGDQCGKINDAELISWSYYLKFIDRIFN